MKRKQDNERMSNKKKAIIAGIVTGVVTVAIAFSIYLDHSSNKEVPTVDTNTTTIEQVIEQENPDINDVISDSTQMDVVIEDVETKVENEGVDSETIVESDTGDEVVEDEETSIVEVEETTETTTPDEEVKEETTETTTPAPEQAKETPQESTEVQPVVPASEAPASSTTQADILKRLEAAGLPVYDDAQTEIIHGSASQGSLIGVGGEMHWE